MLSENEIRKYLEEKEYLKEDIDAFVNDINEEYETKDELLYCFEACVEDYHGNCYFESESDRDYDAEDEEGV